MVFAGTPERHREPFEQKGADRRPELYGLPVGLRLPHEAQQVDMVESFDPAKAEIGPGRLCCDQIGNSPK